MKGQPLTHAERGRLGGLKAAEAMTPQERTIRAQKAGEAAKEALGTSHYVEMSWRRWGRLK